MSRSVGDASGGWLAGGRRGGVAAGDVALRSGSDGVAVRVRPRGTPVAHLLRARGHLPCWRVRRGAEPPPACAASAAGAPTTVRARPTRLRAKGCGAP